MGGTRGLLFMLVAVVPPPPLVMLPVRPTVPPAVASVAPFGMLLLLAPLVEWLPLTMMVVVEGATATPAVLPLPLPAFA
uniref:Putative secreted protein n=1 Tax=Anopheles darlingi TaxID=43151 RepID=A0A2M4D2D7_ANODA